jgi:Protein of unknown function
LANRSFRPCGGESERLTFLYDAKIIMNIEKIEPDGDLSDDEKILVANLSKEIIAEIDEMILSNATIRERKVAMIVALTMSKLPNPPKYIPDIFYAQRVRELVKEGYLEATGYLESMRFCEVRLPMKN